MIAQAFAIIQLILKALQLWGVFLDWMDVNHSKELEERRQRREKAVDEATRATTPEEAFDAQDDIVDNEP